MIPAIAAGSRKNRLTAIAKSESFAIQTLKFTYETGREILTPLRSFQLLFSKETDLIDLFFLKIKRPFRNGLEDPGIFRLDLIADLHFKEMLKGRIFRQSQLFGKFSAGARQIILSCGKMTSHRGIPLARLDPFCHGAFLQKHSSVP